MVRTNFYCVTLFLTMFHASYSYSQRVITLAEAEELFKQRNSELIVSTQKGIIESDAAFEESKKFNNPEFSIDQVNLWSTSGQREGEKEVIPPLFGNVGKNTEFSIGLSQEIRLGGKRNKKIKLEDKNRDVVRFENLETTNDLLLSFKQEIFELNYAKEYAKILEKQKNVYDFIIANYKKQKELGYISSSELLRVQAEDMQILQELNNVDKVINTSIKNIQSQLGCGNNEIADIIVDGSEMRLDKNIDYLYNLSLENPSLLKGQCEIETMQKNIDYERSLSIPDVTVSATYDRAGGVWKDFVGFGVSFTLPVFNRNQAKIKAARRMHDLAEYNYGQQQIKVRNRIRSSYENYKTTLNFLKQLENEPSIINLDKLIDKYKDNVLKKNVSLLEFIDFMETYKNSKNILLETEKELYNQYCMLESVTGVKLKK